MDNEDMISFLEKDNDRKRKNLRMRKFNYIQQHRHILKPLIDAYRHRPDIQKRILEQKIEHESEQDIFSAYQQQIQRLATIDLSHMSASILLTILNKSTTGTYNQGVPVQFVAHCKLVYFGSNCPAAMVCDPYANMPVLFPYHLMDELPVTPGEYYLFSCLIKNGEFLVMGARPLDIATNKT